MKRTLSLLLVLLLSVGLLAGCGGDTKKAGDKTGTNANKDTVYKIATDTTFAPFEFQDKDGKYVGVDIDILEAIAKDQGFKYELSPLGFNAAVAALESNQADAVSLPV